MSSTTDKIDIMLAYENGERIKCKNRNNEGNFIYYHKSNVDQRVPIWDWLKCYYEVVPTKVEFKGFVNIGKKDLYIGSTVYRTQEAAEDNSYTGDDRIAVPVLVTEIIDGYC